VDPKVLDLVERDRLVLAGRVGGAGRAGRALGERAEGAELDAAGGDRAVRVDDDREEGLLLECCGGVVGGGLD
jgi:hypothetical protein